MANGLLAFRFVFEVQHVCSTYFCFNLMNATGVSSTVSLIFI